MNSTQYQSPNVIYNAEDVEDVDNEVSAFVENHAEIIRARSKRLT